MEYTSHTPEETKQIASDFARTLKGGELVFLEGDLGSGKTTFVQGLVGSFGYTEPVRSPTFALMHTYEINHETIKRIIHLDLYRLKHRSELRAFGLEEFLYDPSTVVLVEWPQNGFDVGITLPNKRISIKLKAKELRIIQIL